jgi:hypothetical protein
MQNEILCHFSRENFAIKWKSIPYMTEDLRACRPPQDCIMSSCIRIGLAVGKDEKKVEGKNIRQDLQDVQDIFFLSGIKMKH